jgi:hypothetical protein
MFSPGGSATPGFFYWDGNAQNGTEASGDTPPTGEWVHLCGVYDDEAGAWTMYVDGAVAGSADASVDIELDPVDTTLGYHPEEGTGGRWFPGLMDEVRVYERALSTGEVASIASTDTGTDGA